MNSLSDSLFSVQQMNDRAGPQYFLSGELGLEAGILNWFFELIDARRDRVLWSKDGELTEALSDDEMGVVVCEIANQIILALVDDWGSDR
jgi:TolB-like protein